MKFKFKFKTNHHNRRMIIKKSHALPIPPFHPLHNLDFVVLDIALGRRGTVVGVGA
jgi:hypothetical protein